MLLTRSGGHSISTETGNIVNYEIVYRDYKKAYKKQHKTTLTIEKNSNETHRYIDRHSKNRHDKQ